MKITFCKFSKLQQKMIPIKPTKSQEEKIDHNASSFRFEVLGFFIILIICILVLPFFYDSVLFNSIWTTICSIAVDGRG